MSDGRTMRVSALIWKGNRTRKPMIENHRLGVEAGRIGRGLPPSISRWRGLDGRALKRGRGLPPRGVQSHTQGRPGLARTASAEFCSLAPEGRGGRVGGFKGRGLGE